MLVEPHQIAAHVDLAGDQVDLQLAVADDRRRCLTGGAELRPDAGLELGERERLDQVVDGPGIEAADAILQLAAGGEHDHGQLGALGGEVAQHLHSAAAGEHEVEHHEVDVVTERELEAALAVERRSDLEPMDAETTVDEIHDSGLVLDQDDVRHAPHHTNPFPLQTV